MKQAINNFAKVIGIICIIALITITIIGAVNEPVGDYESLDFFQKGIVLAKQNLDKILSTLGTTASAVCCVLFSTANKTLKLTSEQSELLGGNVQSIGDAICNISKKQGDSDEKTEELQDTIKSIGSLLADLIIASDAPKNLRESANNLKSTLTTIEKLPKELDIEAVANAVVDKLANSKGTHEEKETPVVGENTPSNENDTPVYFG